MVLLEIPEVMVRVDDLHGFDLRPIEHDRRPAHSFSPVAPIEQHPPAA